MTKASNINALRDAGNLEELYSALGPLDMTPGWIDREQPILWSEPNTAFKPMHWGYEECRTALDAAGRLINTELAERRNLILHLIDVQDLAVSFHTTVAPPRPASTLV